MVAGWLWRWPMTDPLDPREAETELALSYAPEDVRPALTALFALDGRLRRITRRARQPLIGTMRLTWWSDALAGLDAGPPPAEPLLTTLAASVVPHGVTGMELADLVDGWDRLLDDEPLDVEAYAAERGERLFVIAARLAGVGEERVRRLGRVWTLADLAQGWPEHANAARSAVGDDLGEVFAKPWPRALRSLGALGLLAHADLAGRTVPGSPRRVARLMIHRLTGR